MHALTSTSGHRDRSGAGSGRKQIQKIACIMKIIDSTSNAEEWLLKQIINAVALVHGLNNNNNLSQ